MKKLFEEDIGVEEFVVNGQLEYLVISEVEKMEEVLEDTRDNLSAVENDEDFISGQIDLNSEIMQERLEEFDKEKKLKVTQKDIDGYSDNYSIVNTKEDLSNRDVKFKDLIREAITDEITKSPVPVYFTDEEKQRNSEENMNLIYFIADKYYEDNRDIYNREDLIDISTLAFVKALNTYDKRIAKKNAFSTYACNCMMNEILNELKKKRIEHNRTNISLDSFIDAKGDTKGRDKMVADIIGTNIAPEQTGSPEVAFRKDYVIHSLKSCIEELSQRDQYIICASYGCFAYELEKQEDIAKTLGTSQGTISRKITEIKKSLRIKLKRNFSINYY